MPYRTKEQGFKSDALEYMEFADFVSFNKYKSFIGEKEGVMQRCWTNGSFTLTDGELWNEYLKASKNGTN